VRCNYAGVHTLLSCLPAPEIFLRQYLSIFLYNLLAALLLAATNDCLFTFGSDFLMQGLA
jgi:hypothetical protein